MGWFKKQFIIIISWQLLSGCISQAPIISTSTPITPPTVVEQEPVIALVNGLLIDGTGDDPISDAVVLIQGERILAAGSERELAVPSQAQIIDAGGGAILPGFIDAHVQKAYDEDRLQAWAQGGVTTVRDETVIGQQSLEQALAIRNRLAGNPRYARLVSAGQIITVPAGYGFLFVFTEKEARQRVNHEIDLGVDLIKLAMEDGTGGNTNLPNLTPDLLRAIVQTAHERGKPVSAHVTRAHYLATLMDAGVDDMAHMPYDHVPDDLFRRMIDQGIYITPTFNVYRNYDAPVSIVVDNLRRFNKLGGKVALGSDYAGGPGEFELGIPMYEIEKMTEAGMTPMQIVVAGTLNAAVVSGIQDEVGTLQPGKAADILVVDGNPLENIQVLRRIKLVIHLGVVIRRE